MRFYKDDADAERAADRRARHGLLLAEWRNGEMSNPTHLVGNSVLPGFQAFAHDLAARAGRAAPNQRWFADNAAQQLEDMAGHHADMGRAAHIPAADREAWGQSAEALRALADRATARRSEAA